jgi:hypothetical protein
VIWLGRGGSLAAPRSPAGALNLGIAWFLAVPAIVVGYGALIWPLGYLLPHDCFSAVCPTESLANLIPPFLAPAAGLLAAAAIMARALQVGIGRRPRPAWRIVGATGIVLMGSAVIAVVVTRSWEVALLAFVWPAFPGIALLDAAWRSGLLRTAGTSRS